MKADEIKIGDSLRFVIPNPRRVVAEKVIVTAISGDKQIISLDNPDDHSDDIYSAHRNPATGNFDCLEPLD